MLGTNSFGLPIHFDQNAFDADGIILLNRIKPHTSFTGRYESGLLKMLAIGLGKRQGAAQVHKLGLPGLKTHAPRGRRVPAQADARWRSGSRSSRTPSSTPRGSSRSSPRSLLEVEPRPARRGPRADGPAAVRPDRRPDRRRAGQELQRDRPGPQRDRPPAGRDDARPAPPGHHPAGRARPLGRDARQRAGDRPGRPDHRAAGPGDRPDADAGQQPDQQLPDPGPRSARLADRPRRDRRLPRHLLADRARRRPGWCSSRTRWS